MISRLHCFLQVEVVVADRAAVEVVAVRPDSDHPVVEAVDFDRLVAGLRHRLLLHLSELFRLR